MIRVVVDSIRVNLLSQQRMVMLREVDNRRYLPIWIGAFEAEAIGAAMQGHEPPRPLTHDLLRNVITELGGTVQYIAVTQLQDTTYYARIVIDVRGVRREIDARPSDAIALGLRVDAPIYVAEQVLEQAGVTLNDEEEEEEEEAEPELPSSFSLPPMRERPATPPAREEAEEADFNDENLSVFRDFINSLEQKKPPEEEQ
ncbi:bifunctional nuclease family protein [Kallotenue papyrolyticum]|uniref:bifunctional nuclease family protein n=1 Tax=Kallotenue papyrolyticum TaxID=1325125 RepID=UPI0004785F5C|nr:bifunctional nuclease family protein [Kallotenue papyrolyticum]